jgi:CcmD family protein
MNKLLPLLFSLFITASALAQGDSASADFMRSNLKMYVVVAVLLIIFLGIVVFLVSLERRLKKLEGK